MMFYEKLRETCISKGTTPTSVCKACGISTAQPTAWKRGTIPDGNTLIKIADYFDVSVDYLLGREPLTDPRDMANSQAIGSLQNGLHRLIREPDRLTLSDIERDVILSMRRQPEMLTPICRLLGIPEPADKAAES